MIMPLSALVIGMVAQRVGVGTTAFANSSWLMLTLLAVAIQVPELLRYSGGRHE